MHTAARNSWGKRQISANALNAPIEAPATITPCGPPESAWIAGTTSLATACWNWLNSQHRYSGVPASEDIARPAMLSHE